MAERPYERPVGRAAYEAYRDAAGGASLATGDPLPDWTALPEPVREAWDAAGMAARALPEDEAG